MRYLGNGSWNGALYYSFHSPLLDLRTRLRLIAREFREERGLTWGPSGRRGVLFVRKMALHVRRSIGGFWNVALGPIRVIW